MWAVSTGPMFTVVTRSRGICLHIQMWAKTELANWQNIGKTFATLMHNAVPVTPHCTLIFSIYWWTSIHVKCSFCSKIPNLVFFFSWCLPKFCSNILHQCSCSRLGFEVFQLKLLRFADLCKKTLDNNLIIPLTAWIASHKNICPSEKYLVVPKNICQWG